MPSALHRGECIAATPPVVLTFAASDPGCGAGVQADLLTLAALGCHPLTVLTAITIQDTVGVQQLYPLDPEWITDQARVLLADMPVAAFKIGVLGHADNARAVASILADFPDVPVVLDPVLASGRGDSFGDEALLTAICSDLLPRTTVVTPNVPEAKRLCQRDSCEDSSADVLLADHAMTLIRFGAKAVLVTGTHADTPVVCNRLFDVSGQIQEQSWSRLPGSYHGSGCTLASALAAGLAQGLTLMEADRQAQTYVWQSLTHAYAPGRGQFVPDRLWKLSGDAGGK